MVRQWKSKERATFELECLLLIIIFIYSTSKFKVSCKNRNFEWMPVTKPCKIFDITFFILSSYQKQYLKVDMPILTCIFFTFNWLTLTSEMHFVKFYPVVASCLLSRGKRKYASLGMRLLWKYIRNYFLVYQLISLFLVYLQNYKEFGAEILDLQSEKYGLSFDIKKHTTSGWALGDENVIGIRAFKLNGHPG